MTVKNNHVKIKGVLLHVTTNQKLALSHEKLMCALHRMSEHVEEKADSGRIYVSCGV